MFILALILLLSAFQFAKPSLQVPIDNDVGICYVAPMEQSVEVVNLADNITITALDVWSPANLDVEESRISFMYAPQSNSQSIAQCMYWQSSTASYGKATQPNQKNRDLGGLDTGEIFPRAGAMVRHI